MADWPRSAHAEVIYKAVNGADSSRAALPLARIGAWALANNTDPMQKKCEKDETSQSSLYGCEIRGLNKRSGITLGLVIYFFFYFYNQFDFSLCSVAFYSFSFSFLQFFSMIHNKLFFSCHVLLELCG